LIENWKTLLLTFVVGAFVYLFSAATAEYRQIRQDIHNEATGQAMQDRNTLKFSALASSVTERQRGRVQSLRVLEHNPPTEPSQVASAILAISQAERDCATDAAVLSGFSTPDASIAHAQQSFLSLFKAENNLRNAITMALKANTLNGSSDVAALDALLVQKAQMVSSALDEEQDHLKALDDIATNSIREYDSRYDVLGIKILSALVFVIAGSATLAITFLRERSRKLSQERFDQGLSA
jgi:hypothetical protein